MTGSGKSYFCNFVLQNAQKYNPLTFIFDIGGSFQSLTTIFGGSYLNVGQESRDFASTRFRSSPPRTICSFSFPSSASSSRATISVTGWTSRKSASCGMPSSACTYWSPSSVLSRTSRSIIGELKERLHRWTQGGQYGFLFDNVVDTLVVLPLPDLQFSRLGRCPGGPRAAALLRAPPRYR